MDHDDISENSVFSKENLKEKQLEKLKEKLQDTHASLTESFSKLKEKTTGEKENGEFRDPRVNELWERAQNGKFTEDELDSIKVKKTTWKIPGIHSLSIAQTLIFTCSSVRLASKSK